MVLVQIFTGGDGDFRERTEALLDEPDRLRPFFTDNPNYAARFITECEDTAFVARVLQTSRIAPGFAASRDIDSVVSAIQRIEDPQDKVAVLSTPQFIHDLLTPQDPNQSTAEEGRALVNEISAFDQDTQVAILSSKHAVLGIAKAYAGHDLFDVLDQMSTDRQVSVLSSDMAVRGLSAQGQVDRVLSAMERMNTEQVTGILSQHMTLRCVLDYESQSYVSEDDETPHRTIGLLTKLNFAQRASVLAAECAILSIEEYIGPDFLKTMKSPPLRAVPSSKHS